MQPSHRSILGLRQSMHVRCRLTYDSEDSVFTWASPDCIGSLTDGRAKSGRAHSAIAEEMAVVEEMAVDDRVQDQRQQVEIQPKIFGHHYPLFPFLGLLVDTTALQ